MDNQQTPYFPPPPGQAGAYPPTLPPRPGPGYPPQVSPNPGGPAVNATPGGWQPQQQSFDPSYRRPVPPPFQPASPATQFSPVQGQPPPLPPRPEYLQPPGGYYPGSTAPTGSGGTSFRRGLSTALRKSWAVASDAYSEAYQQVVNDLNRPPPGAPGYQGQPQHGSGNPAGGGGGQWQQPGPQQYQQPGPHQNQQPSYPAMAPPAAYPRPGGSPAVPHQQPSSTPGTPATTPGYNWQQPVSHGPAQHQYHPSTPSPGPGPIAQPAPIPPQLAQQPPQQPIPAAAELPDTPSPTLSQTRPSRQGSTNPLEHPLRQTGTVAELDSGPVSASSTPAPQAQQQHKYPGTAAELSGESNVVSVVSPIPNEPPPPYEYRYPGTAAELGRGPAEPKTTPASTQPEAASQPQYRYPGTAAELARPQDSGASATASAPAQSPAQPQYRYPGTAAELNPTKASSPAATVPGPDQPPAQPQYRSPGTAAEFGYSANEQKPPPAASASDQPMTQPQYRYPGTAAEFGQSSQASGPSPVSPAVQPQYRYPGTAAELKNGASTSNPAATATSPAVPQDHTPSMGSYPHPGTVSAPLESQAPQPDAHRSYFPPPPPGSAPPSQSHPPTTFAPSATPESHPDSRSSAVANPAVQQFTVPGAQQHGAAASYTNSFAYSPPPQSQPSSTGVPQTQPIEPATARLQRTSDGGFQIIDSPQQLGGPSATSKTYSPPPQSHPASVGVPQAQPTPSIEPPMTQRYEDAPSNAIISQIDGLTSMVNNLGLQRTSDGGFQITGNSQQLGGPSTTSHTYPPPPQSHPSYAQAQPTPSAEPPTTQRFEDVPHNTTISQPSLQQHNDGGYQITGRGRSNNIEDEYWIRPLLNDFIPLTGDPSPVMWDCPGSRLVTFETSWYHLPSVPEFLVCTRCHDRFIANKPHSDKFQKTLRPSGRCRFNVPRVTSTLLPEARRTGDIRALEAYFSSRMEMKDCPGKTPRDKSDGYKFFTLQPGQIDSIMENFLACEACHAELVATARPDYAREFIAKEQPADKKWLCDFAFTYTRRLFVQVSRPGATTPFLDWASQAVKRYSIPQCEGEKAVESSSRAWARPGGRHKVEGFVMCEACFMDHVALTPLEHEFEMVRLPKPHTGSEWMDKALGYSDKEATAWFCDASQNHIIEAITLAVKRQDIAIFTRAATTVMTAPACTKDGIANGTWYTLAGGHPDWGICERCFVAYAAIWGNERHFEIAPCSGSPQALHCTFSPVAVRFQQFVDTFIQATNVGPWSLFPDTVRKWSGVPECPKDTHVNGRNWWGFGDCLICQDCWISFASEVPGCNTTLPLEIVDGVVEEGRMCSMYSPRMRGLFTSACASGSSSELVQFSEHRIRVWAQTMPQVKMLRQMQEMHMMSAMSAGMAGLMYQGAGSIQAISGSTDGYLHGSSSLGWHETENHAIAAQKMGEMSSGMAMANSGGTWGQIMMLTMKWKEVE